MKSKYLPPILRRVAALGHVVFDSGDFDLNLIGVRSPSRQPDRWDDEFMVVWKQGGVWRQLAAQATTDPGGWWLINGQKATAIMVPGQYRGVYKIDLHAGKYPALCQRGGVVRVYRDGNKNQVLDHDPATITEGYFGINIHRASAHHGDTKIVGKYSAGCTVIRNPEDFRDIMELARTQIATHPDWAETFTYTLIEG